MQSRYGRSTGMLTWEHIRVGPENDCQWTTVAYGVYLIFTVHVKITYHCRIVNSEEVGRGTSGQKSGAAEEAARQALLNLRDY
jgi:hypothetical protein